MSQNDTVCQYGNLNISDLSFPDLTVLLIALEIANGISDPVGRYQALFAIADGFNMDYSQVSHLSALYLSEA